jgi:hypothetical protein
VLGNPEPLEEALSAALRGNPRERTTSFADIGAALGQALPTEAPAEEGPPPSAEDGTVMVPVAELTAPEGGPPPVPDTDGTVQMPLGELPTAPEGPPPVPAEADRTVEVKIEDVPPPPGEGPPPVPDTDGTVQMPLGELPPPPGEGPPPVPDAEAGEEAPPGPPPVPTAEEGPPPVPEPAAEAEEAEEPEEDAEAPPPLPEAEQKAAPEAEEEAPSAEGEAEAEDDATRALPVQEEEPADDEAAEGPPPVPEAEEEGPADEKQKPLMEWVGPPGEEMPPEVAEEMEKVPEWELDDEKEKPAEEAAEAAPEEAPPDEAEEAEEPVPEAEEEVPAEVEPAPSEQAEEESTEAEEPPAVPVEPEEAPAEPAAAAEAPAEEPDRAAPQPAPEPPPQPPPPFDPHKTDPSMVVEQPPPAPVQPTPPPPAPTPPSAAAPPPAPVQPTPPPPAPAPPPTPAPPVEQPKAPPPPSLARAEKPPAEKPKLGTKPLLFIAAGAAVVVVVVVLLVVFLGGEEEPMEPVVITEVMPTPIPTPIPLPEPEPEPEPMEEEPLIHPQLEAAELLMLDGDQDGARQALEVLTEEEIELFSETEVEIYQELMQSFQEGMGVEEAVADLEGGLKIGSVIMLGRAVPSLADLDQAQLDEHPGLKQNLERGREALRTYQLLKRAHRAKDQLQVLELASTMARILPGNDKSRQYRGEAARFFESRAERAVADNRIADALADLEKVRAHWPDRPGLARRFDDVRGAQAARGRLQQVLNDALVKGESGDPEAGLKLLASAQPTGSFKPLYQEARKQLEAQLAQLDAQAPRIALATPGQPPRFKKKEPIRIALDITDDYRVASTRLMVKTAAAPRFVERPLEHGGGNRYLIVIPPAAHGGKDVLIYVEATDVSGHTAQLGSPQQPVRIERKGLFK